MLGNTPALKILSLRDYNLTLMDLESIHSKAPLLTSLSFYATAFDVNIYPAAVTPTNAITELNLAELYISNNREYLTFQKYVTQKYPKITSMEYSVNVSITGTLHLLEEGYIPQLQRIAPTLTSLNLKQSKYIPFTFPALDQSGCQLKELTIGLPLTEEDVITITTSKQSQFIQKLSLARVRAHHFVEHLTGLTSLKSLNFSYRPNMIRWDELSMDTLLEAVGDTITTLEIGNAQLLMFADIASTYPGVKTLILRECHLPYNTGSFISKKFPELQNLIIYYCTFNISLFDLGELNLSYLEFRDPIPPNQRHILIETRHDNQKRQYSAERLSPSNRFPTGHRANFPAVKSRAVLRHPSPYATFICNSVQEFMLVNTPPP